jgi:hypothetical protein
MLSGKLFTHRRGAIKNIESIFIRFYHKLNPILPWLNVFFQDEWLAIFRAPFFWQDEHGY